MTRSVDPNQQYGRVNLMQNFAEVCSSCHLPQSFPELSTVAPFSCNFPFEYLSLQTFVIPFSHSFEAENIIFHLHETEFECILSTSFFNIYGIPSQCIFFLIFPVVFTYRLNCLLFLCRTLKGLYGARLSSQLSDWGRGDCPRIIHVLL